MNAPHITETDLEQVLASVLALFAEGSEPLDPTEFDEVETDADVITLLPPTAREIRFAEAA